MTAYERVLDALAEHGARVQTRGDGRASAQCPGHDDRNASLSLAAGRSGALLKCHAGCDVEGILAAIQLTRRDLFDSPKDRTRGFAVVAEYPYRDAAGAVLYVKERRFPKDFRQYRAMPGGKRDYSLGNVTRVLYRLPEVVEAVRTGAPVWVAEGEKDADTLTRAGVCGTTWGDGAWKPGQAPKWRHDYTAALTGAHVVIVGDDDVPGRHTAETIAKLLAGAAASVRVLFPRVGKDVTDHITAGETLATLQPAAEPAPDNEEDTAEVHRGHLRMSERVVREHGRDLRHVRRLGWYSWDGARWCEDEDDEPSRRVIATLKGALAESVREHDTELRDDVRRCESANGLDGVLRITGKLKPVALSHTALDRDPNILVTPAGTVDLADGSIRPNRRDDHVTRVTAAGPGDEGRELWDRFITRVLPDADVREFVQRLMGVALIGEVREQVLPIFTGTGANGKGVFRDALLHTFGEYALEVDPSLLMESKHEKHGTYKMALRGRRLVFTSETEKGRRFAEATMKRLTGGDPIQANLMHKDAITFDPSHTLIMVTNFLPEVSGDDPAVWRRILIVPFDVVIPVPERDPELPRKLKAAAPAVLAWCLDGLRQYRQQGLNAPEAVRVRTEAYRASSDVIARFLDERCHRAGNATVRAAELLGAYQRWCLDNGEKPEAVKQFAESLESRGIRKKRTSMGQVYQGIGLYADDEEAA